MLIHAGAGGWAPLPFSWRSTSARRSRREDHIADRGCHAGMREDVLEGATMVFLRMVKIPRSSPNAAPHPAPIRPTSRLIRGQAIGAGCGAALGLLLGIFTIRRNTIVAPSKTSSRIPA